MICPGKYTQIIAVQGVCIFKLLYFYKSRSCSARLVLSKICLDSHLKGRVTIKLSKLIIIFFIKPFLEVQGVFAPQKSYTVCVLNRGIEFYI